jgi:hypothetical protein
VALPAARAAKLGHALAAAREAAGHAFVVPDSALIRIAPVAAGRPFYPGKHRRHGMNPASHLQHARRFCACPGPLPDAVHDLTAARIWGIIRELADAGLIMLAHKGYIGAGEPA